MVTAELETLNRTSAEVGGLVEAKQIKEIPISGRNWASLMLLAPGAINYGDGAQRNIRSTAIRSTTATSPSTASTPAASRNRPRRPTRA